MKPYAILVLMLLIAGAVGCSSQSDNPYVPNDGASELRLNEGSSSRGILGMWQVSIDPSTLDAAVIPLRAADIHYDVTVMVLPPACPDCLSVEPQGINSLTQILDVDVVLTNRYQQDAYDVRVILETSSLGFKLTNADDWTSLWDMPGGGTINPFLAYARDVDLRKFAIAAEHTRKALIYLPDLTNLPDMVFAVDVSWPDNCKEPYTIDNFVQGGILYSTLGSIAEIFVDVHDWQNNVDKVTLVAPMITGAQFIQFTHYLGDTWRLVLVNNTGIAPGDYPVRVIGRASDSPLVPLHDYFTVTVSP